MTESLRADALEIFRAGVSGVDPEARTRAAISSRSITLSQGWNLLAIGKAATSMSRGAVTALAGSLRSGLVVSTGGELGYPVIRELRGDHPIPGVQSERAGRAVFDWVTQLDSDSSLLVLLSGGASALVTAPAGRIRVGDVASVTTLLLKAGATITELNTVRKHLDRLKGGQLARCAASSQIVGLVISDVVGNDLSTIASGPLSPDPTRFDDAIDVLKRYGVWEAATDPVREQLLSGSRGEIPETPTAQEASLEKVDLDLIATNRDGLEAASQVAQRLGYQSTILSDGITGEAREVARAWAGQIRAARLKPGRPRCLLGGGETTVTVCGPGRGGPNQELALATALELDRLDGWGFLSAGSDGIDGPTDAAGAFVDGLTADRAREHELDLASALAANDSYSLLESLQALVRTGETGTNVMDFHVALIR